MTALPYGTWPSPIRAEDVAAASPRYDGAAFVGDEVWWAESVPAEGGRMTIRARGGDGVRTVLPMPWNVRSRVHEYGGGAWAVDPAGPTLYFSDHADGRIRRLAPDGTVSAVTPDEPGTRYGGLRVDRGRVLAVRERETAGAPARAIVELTPDANAVVLAEDADFVAQPTLSPDGTRLAYVAWNHPHMPWDATEVRVVTLGGPDGPVAVTSGCTAALQPEWAADGSLRFIDDPDDRWNLFSWDGGGVRAIAPADADTGGALWVLGTRWYAVLDDERIVAIRTNGADEVVLIDGDDVTPLRVDIASGAILADVRGGEVLVFGASATRPTALWRIDADAGRAELVTGGISPWAAEWLPEPAAVRVDGPRGPVHAVHYPPRNPDATAPAGALPPTVVLVHGGPTSHVGPAASGAVAFLTSRGIGVLDVNYGGSTGYGRAYRERLRGEWGVVDVEDTAAAARGLADAGLADPTRLAIRGGSAGGWTVLAALARTDVFAAGISRYGVGDARALAAETHDFERRYLDGLIGPLPEAEAVYVERSPLSHAAGFRAPILLLQGEDDAVVPPSQAEAIRDALAARGIPHALVVYPGEGHGFRRRETVIDVLQKELAFLGAVFGFESPDVPPLPLDGRDASPRPLSDR